LGKIIYLAIELVRIDENYYEEKEFNYFRDKIKSDLKEVDEHLNLLSFSLETSAERTGYHF